MNLKEEQSGGVTIVQVSGRIDSTSAPVLGQRLTAVLDEVSARVLVDMSEVDYISSAGFRVLLLAGRRAEQIAGKIVLSGVSGKVRQLFDLGGFLDLFVIANTRDEGVTAAG